MSQFPFNDYEMTTEKTQRCPLTAKEISRIANLKLTPINKLCDAREIFLMESYTGIRIGDILTLKWKNYNKQRLSFMTRKCGIEMNLELGGIAMEIIEKRRRRNRNNGEINLNDYIFNILDVDLDKATKRQIHNAISSATAIINKRLKEIAIKAQIKKNLSTHIARHNKMYYRLLINRLHPFCFSIGNDLETSLVLRYASFPHHNKEQLIFCKDIKILYSNVYFAVNFFSNFHYIVAENYG